MLLISAFHSTEEDIQWKTANPWLCVERHSEQYDPWVRKIPCRRHPTPVFLPGKFHGQRSLVGYSPWGRKESNTSEWLTSSLHFRLDRVMLKVLSNAEPIETQTCFISVTFCETFWGSLATDWAFRNRGWFPKLPRRNGKPTNAIIENQDIIMK